VRDTFYVSTDGIADNETKAKEGVSMKKWSLVLMMIMIVLSVSTPAKAANWRFSIEDDDKSWTLYVDANSVIEHKNGPLWLTFWDLTTYSTVAGTTQCYQEVKRGHGYIQIRTSRCTNYNKNGVPSRGLPDSNWLDVQPTFPMWKHILVAKDIAREKQQ